MDPFDDGAGTVTTCVVGMARADETALRRAFHPKAASIGHFARDLEWASVDQFIAACKAEAIVAGAPVPTHEVEAILVTEDTARVRGVNVWAGLEFRDTVTLLLRDGRWQIVSKVFLHLGKA